MLVHCTHYERMDDSLGFAAFCRTRYEREHQPVVAGLGAPCLYPLPILSAPGPKAALTGVAMLSTPQMPTTGFEVIPTSK